MNIEQEKMEAQEGMDKELPEEARTPPETEELSDGELEGVNGGFSLTLNIQTGGGKKPWPAAGEKKPQASTLVYHPTTPPAASTLEYRGDAGGKIELL